MRHLLVSPEDISCIYLILYIIQTSIIAVGDNRLALRLESIHIIHHLATKEGGTVLQCRLVDNHSAPFALIRFMMPWMADWRKLSLLLFIMDYYICIYSESAASLFINLPSSEKV